MLICIRPVMKVGFCHFLAMKFWLSEWPVLAENVCVGFYEPRSGLDISGLSYIISHLSYAYASTNADLIIEYSIVRSCQKRYQDGFAACGFNSFWFCRLLRDYWARHTANLGNLIMGKIKRRSDVFTNQNKCNRKVTFTLRFPWISGKKVI